LPIGIVHSHGKVGRRIAHMTSGKSVIAEQKERMLYRKYLFKLA
jgi:hypothetical protein